MNNSQPFELKASTPSPSQYTTPQPFFNYGAPVAPPTVPTTAFGILWIK